LTVYPIRYRRKKIKEFEETIKQLEKLSPDSDLSWTKLEDGNFGLSTKKY
jgi:hypothetical protein